MNVGEIKAVVGSYFELPALADAVKTHGTTSVDLLLVALNNARRYAEKRHDWSFTEVSCDLKLDLLSGTSWSTLPLHGVPMETVSLRKLRAAWIADDNGQLVPIEVVTKKDLHQRMTKVSRRSRLVGETWERVPSDAESSVQSCEMLLLQGTKLFSYPGETAGGTKDVVVDGWKWIDAYVSDDDTDWFTEYGHEYLIYAAVCEVNLLFKKFLPRQEGELAPPVQDRENALKILIVEDSYISSGIESTQMD